MIFLLVRNEIILTHVRPNCENDQTLSLKKNIKKKFGVKKPFIDGVKNYEFIN
mgnify:CR=1 FL=1